MSTQHYTRPSASYAGEAGLSNRTLFQDTSATRPRVPISSSIVDGQINYLVDAVNELYDLGVTGSLPDKSVTIAKIADMTEGSVISFDSSDEAILVNPSGNAGYVLTENSSGAPSFQPSVGVPSGSIITYAGAVAPAGWLMCAGQDVSRATYSSLFTAISTTYGAGDGSTTFTLPDLRGRAVFGKDNMGGTAASRVTSAVSGVSGTTLGATGGDQRAQLHTHNATVTDPGHKHVERAGGTASTEKLVSNGGGGSVASGIYFTGGLTTSTTLAQTLTDLATTGVTVALDNAGSGTSQNMPPAIMLNYIIKT